MKNQELGNWTTTILELSYCQYASEITCALLGLSDVCEFVLSIERPSQMKEWNVTIHASGPENFHSIGVSTSNQTQAFEMFDQIKMHMTHLKVIDCDELGEYCKSLSPRFECGYFEDYRDE